MAAELSIERVAGGYRLAGEVDLSNAHQLQDLNQPGEGDLVVDLSALQFMDSTGLRAFIQLAQSLEGSRRVLLRNPSSAVARLFELTGIDQLSNLVVEEG